MKSRHATAAPFIRPVLCAAALLAGLFLIYRAGEAAGSVGQAMGEVLDGSWSSAGFFPFVLGVLCLIYAAVGLLFRREDR
jgi:hypothetical protein